MHKRITQIGGAAAAALAISATASADVKLNENFSVGGYAAGSYRTTEESSTDKFDLDAAKLAFNTTFNPVTGTASIYYTGATPGDDLTLLDAYVNYDAGSGVVITGGKFLSYLGYEAFDIPNMTQISYANGDFLAPIPGYHSGVKIGYSDKAYSAGLALVDSVYGGTAFKGDGELKKNQGYEGFVSYTGVEGLTLWAGFGYQTEGDYMRDQSGQKVYANGAAGEEIFTYDFWAQYAVSKEITVAAEYVNKSSFSADGYNWLTYFSYQFDPKVSLVARISGEKVDNGPSFTKYTLSPTYKITDNLSVRAEVSQYDYKDYGMDKDTFYGLQAVFKF
ncbi:outer membrane beta-barrel protein [Nibricoccus sp. IMCC34717]|uniref:outer membrane beta-barrel protein n=1 Tax=Nibricoccus sp. IMCC34717 TaxID=3034021 RepID=UPI0038502D2E